LNFESGIAMRFYFLPYQKLEFTVAGPPHTVTQRLAAALTATPFAGCFYFPPLRLPWAKGDPGFVGKVDGDTFYFFRCGWASRNYVVAKGHITKDAVGARVEMVVSYPLLGLIFLGLWFSIACVIVVSLLTGTILGYSEPLVTTLVASAICVIYLLIMYEYARLTDQVFRFIDSLFPGAARGR
jgi:hypothetical protein